MSIATAADHSSADDKVVLLDASRVRPSPFANRMPFNTSTAEFQALKDSIEDLRRNDVPICVRPLPQFDAFEIVYGHRRHAACAELGLPVRAVVKEVDDKTLVRLMYMENQRREPLCPYENGRFLAQIKAIEGCSDRDIAKLLGLDASTVSKLLVLASLPEVLVNAFRSPKDLKVEYGARLRAAWHDDPNGMASRAEALSLRNSEYTPQQIFDRLVPRESNVIEANIRFKDVHLADIALKPKQPSLIRMPAGLPLDLELMEHVLGKLLHLGRLRQDREPDRREISDTVIELVTSLCHVMDVPLPKWPRSECDPFNDLNLYLSSLGDPRVDASHTPAPSACLYGIRRRADAREVARRALALGVPAGNIGESALVNWIYSEFTVVSEADIPHLAETYVVQRVACADEAGEDRDPYDPDLLDHCLEENEHDREQVEAAMPAANELYQKVLEAQARPNGLEVIKAALQFVDLNRPNVLSVSSEAVAEELVTLLTEVGRLIGRLPIVPELTGDLAEALEGSILGSAEAKDDMTTDAVWLAAELLRTSLVLDRP